MTTIGMIGCGAIGSGIVKNLLLHHYDVLAYDVDANNQRKAEELGATGASDLYMLASASDFVLLSLPTPEIVKDCIIGKNGILQWMKKETAILDMSTTDVATTRELYKEAENQGIAYFDCPVSNGPKGAIEGTLTIMAGGNEQLFHKIEPVLKAIGKEIRYIGESGSGQVVKLCNNMIVAGLVILLSETLITGVKSGVSADKIAEIMQLGSASNRVLSVFGPNLLNNTHDHVLFMLNHMKKDVDLYLQMAELEDTPTILSSSVQHLFAKAKNEGLGQLDTTAVSQLLENIAKQKITQ